jgi:hypothetical protein
MDINQNLIYLNYDIKIYIFIKIIFNLVQFFFLKNK